MQMLEGPKENTCFHFASITQWNVHVMAASSSTELEIIGKVDDTFVCWSLDDTARAQLPLVSGDETYPRGVCFDFTSTTLVPLNSSEDATGGVAFPCPRLLFINNAGMVSLLFSYVITRKYMLL
jgi:hypothetical protein